MCSVLRAACCVLWHRFMSRLYGVCTGSFQLRNTWSRAARHSRIACATWSHRSRHVTQRSGRPAYIWLPRIRNHGSLLAVLSEFKAALAKGSHTKMTFRSFCALSSAASVRPTNTPSVCRQSTLQLYLSLHALDDRTRWSRCSHSLYMSAVASSASSPDVIVFDDDQAASTLPTAAIPPDSTCAFASADPFKITFNSQHTFDSYGALQEYFKQCGA